MTETIMTLIGWDGPRPAARDVARLLAAYLVSVVTRRPIEIAESGTMWRIGVAITPISGEA